jgi:hypothetical protein
MRVIFKTKSSRAFLVLLGLIVSGSIGTWYWGGPTHVNPTDFYYWTQKFSEAGVDIRSPNSKAVIEVDAYPTMGWPLSMYREGRRKLRERCDAAAGFGGAEWRGVTLCNTANLNNDEFEVAHNYFKVRVDEDYNEFYGGTACDLLVFIFVALTSWCFLLLGWRIYRWVVAAPVSPSI